MVIVCALYKFVRLENYASLQQPLLDLMLAHRVRGTLLLATEGINGTIAGSREGIDQVLDWLRAVPAFENLDHKESVSEELPFKRSRSVRWVRLWGPSTRIRVLSVSFQTLQSSIWTKQNILK